MSRRQRSNEGPPPVDRNQNLKDLPTNTYSQTSTVNDTASKPLASAASTPPMPSIPLPPSSSTTATTPSVAATGAAAAAAASKGGSSYLRSHQKFSPAMNTINSTASDGYGSDSLPGQHPPPPHPMFHSLHEDSDGSDGSIVFNNKKKKAPKKQPVKGGRDRFPSFDSMASSGSLIQHGPSFPSPQAPKVVTQQNLAKVDPQMLPYDQRRKLMKMKEQQQQAQRNPSPPQQPRRPPPPQPDGRYMQYMGPPPDFHHHPQQNSYNMVNGIPMGAGGAPHSPQGGFMYPMHQPPPPLHMSPQQQHQQQHHMHPGMHSGMQVPFGAFPPPPQLNNNNPKLSPYRSVTPPQRFDPNRPPPQGAMMRHGSGGRGRSYPPQQQQQQHQLPIPIPMNHPMYQQQQHHQQHQQQLQGRPLPPTSMSRQQQPAGVTRDPRFAHSASLDSAEPDSQAARQNANSRLAHSNSLDSSDAELQYGRRDNKSDAQPSSSARNHQGQQQQQQQHSSTIEPSNSINSIPPPPPPPPHPHHVRAESSGSVSSLGSQGSLFGYFRAGANNDDNAPKRERRSTFLQRLNPFSPKQPQNKSPQQTATDFRRQNQDFLLKQQSATARRPARQPSPQRSQHQRVASMDRPPASRGTHKRLPSIENDNWEEPESRRYGIDRVSSSEQSKTLSSSEETEDDRALTRGGNQEGVNEQTSLLPPPGQGSSEYPENNRYSESHRSNRRRQKQKSSRRNQRGQEQISSRHRENEAAISSGDRNADDGYENKRTQRKQNKKKKQRRRSRRARNVSGDDYSDSSDGSGRHSSSSSSYDYRQWTRRRAQMLEDERTRMIAQWKAEARTEALNSRRTREANTWHQRTGQYLDSEFGDFLGKSIRFLTSIEAFICNLPLTVGAIAMSIVTLGMVWFKFVEEALTTCEPVQFHSSQCSWPEFPGCFYCETATPMYEVAANFHFVCSAVAGVLALSFVLKLLLATQVVLDEMSSPTTASPAGLICMTLVCVFAGRGFLGQIVVSMAACLHLCLVIWFIYMALAYHIMPDPSWFPNTVGIGMSAVKIWLYYPTSGHFLMAISLALNFFFFPISLIRVVMNEKISATVGFMQMSAPSISLYALTIMAQPSFEQEKPDINRFQRAHRFVYLPAMHFLFVLSVVGLLASVQSFVVRWKDFKKREFSPAHAAFCFPTLLHANSIQAYRAAINSFSAEPLGSPWKEALNAYWLFVLIGGTCITLWVTAKFFYNLPSWTDISVDDEEEPPAPYETTMTLQNVIATGESLVQPFVSPAVLQANETGALIMVRRGRHDNRQRFVRTRKLAALGFEPIMTWSEVERERELLLEWVGKHPPRRRNRTLSVPGIDFSYGPDFGVGNSGIYGVDLDAQQDMAGGIGRAHADIPFEGF